MKDMKEMNDKFIQDCRESIKKENQEDNHCIILYKCKGMWNERKHVHKVYKNIDEYASKSMKDLQEIDFDFGISPQLWFFD